MRNSVLLIFLCLLTGLYSCLNSEQKADVIFDNIKECYYTNKHNLSISDFESILNQYKNDLRNIEVTTLLEQKIDNFFFNELSNHLLNIKINEKELSGNVGSAFRLNESEDTLSIRMIDSKYKIPINIKRVKQAVTDNSNYITTVNASILDESRMEIPFRGSCSFEVNWENLLNNKSIEESGHFIIHLSHNLFGFNILSRIEQYIIQYNAINNAYDIQVTIQRNKKETKSKSVDPEVIESKDTDKSEPDLFYLSSNAHAIYSQQDLALFVRYLKYNDKNALQKLSSDGRLMILTRGIEFYIIEITDVYAKILLEEDNDVFWIGTEDIRRR